MLFDQKTWERFAKGYLIQDCAYGFDGRYCFVLTEESPEEDVIPQTKFLFVRPERPVERRFYAQAFSNYRQASISYGEAPKNEFIGVDLSGHVYAYYGDKASDEKDIYRDLPNSKYLTPFSKCVRIDGVVHAIAWDRRIYRRRGIDNWDEITQHPSGIPYDQLSLTGNAALELGFEDAAAFSDNDIYAVGGSGDVWHFNGKAWRQIHFPSNELLYTVCCAGDGKVYITGNNGSLWVGRENSWQRLAEGKFSANFKDTAWFAGKLFCGNSYGLWILKDGRLEALRNEVDSVVATSVGRIDVSPDGKLMLTAGPYGASIYDGEKWEVLFNAMQLA